MHFENTPVCAEMPPIPTATMALQAYLTPRVRIQMLRDRHYKKFGDQLASLRDTEEVLTRKAEKLEARLDQMATICQAMWNLLAKQVGVSEDALQKEISRLSSIQNQSVRCPQCAKVVAPKHTHCMYCGAEVPRRFNTLL